MRRSNLRGTAAVCLLVAGLAGCSSSDPGTRAAAAPRPADDEEIRYVRRLAYREMQALSRRTCAAVPRRVLWRSLAAVSDDRATARGPDDENGIALLFAEDVAIRGIALQRAAYDGCLRGLGSQR